MTYVLDHKNRSPSAQAKTVQQSNEEEVLEEEANAQDEKAAPGKQSTGVFAAQIPVDPQDSASRIILPLVYGLLEQAGQWLLEEFRKAIWARYGNQINVAQQVAVLVKELQDPQLSIQKKLESLMDFIPKLGLSEEVARPVQSLLNAFHDALNLAQQTGDLQKRLNESDGLIPKIDAISKALKTLLSTPFKTPIVLPEALRPIRDWLQMAQEWSSWILPLSKASWDDPQAFLKVLERSGALPTWISALIPTIQDFYHDLPKKIKKMKPKAAPIQAALARLKKYMSAFTKAKKDKSVSGQLSVLMNTLLDEEVASLVEEYAPTELRNAFQMLSFGRQEMQKLPVEEGGIRTTLLSMQRLIDPEFGEQLAQAVPGSGVGAYLRDTLSHARAQLIPSKTMVSAMNLLVQATDPKVTWTTFVQSVMKEVAQMPEMQGVALSIVVNYASGFGQVGRSLVELGTNKAFWERYSRTSWSEMPAFLGTTIWTDLTNPFSHIGQIVNAMTGVPVETARQTVIFSYAVLGLLWKIWGIITAEDSKREYNTAKPELEKLMAYLPSEMNIVPALLEGLSWVPLLVEIKKAGASLCELNNEESWFDWGAKLLEVAKNSPHLQQQIRVLLEPSISKLPMWIRTSVQGVAKDAGLDLTSSTPSGGSYGTALLEFCRGTAQLLKPGPEVAEAIEDFMGRIVDPSSLFPLLGQRRRQNPSWLRRGITEESRHRAPSEKERTKNSGSSLVLGAGAGALGLVSMLLIGAAIQGAHEQTAAKVKASALNSERESEEGLVSAQNSEGKNENKPSSDSDHANQELLDKGRITTDEPQLSQNLVEGVWNKLKAHPHLTGILGLLSLAAAGYVGYNAYTHQAVTPPPEEEQHQSIQEWLETPITSNSDETPLDEIYDLLLLDNDANLFDDESRLQAAIKNIVTDLKGNAAHSENNRRQKRSQPEQSDYVETNPLQNASTDEAVKVITEEARLLQKFTQAYDDYITYVTYGGNRAELEKLNRSTEYRPLWELMAGYDQDLWSRYDKRSDKGKEAILGVYDELISGIEKVRDTGRNPLLKKRWKKKYLELEKNKQKKQFERIEKIVKHLFTVGRDSYENLYDVGPPRENMVLTMRLLRKEGNGKIGNHLIPDNATDDELMQIAEKIYDEEAKGINEGVGTKLRLMEITYFYVSNKIKESRSDLNDKTLTPEIVLNDFYKASSPSELKLKYFFDFYDKRINPDYPMGLNDIKPNLKVEPNNEPESNEDGSIGHFRPIPALRRDKRIMTDEKYYKQFTEYEESASLEAHALITQNIVNSGAMKATDLDGPPKSIVTYKLEAFSAKHGATDSGEVGSVVDDFLSKDPDGTAFFITTQSDRRYVLSTLFNDFVFKEISKEEFKEYTKYKKFDPKDKNGPTHSFFDLITHEHENSAIKFDWTDFNVISNLRDCTLLPGSLSKLISWVVKPGKYQMHADSGATHSYNRLQTFLEEQQTSVLKARANILKGLYYKEDYLQECLNNSVPFYKMVKTLIRDKGYKPSVEEWITDAIDATLTILMMVIPLIGAGKMGVLAAKSALQQAAIQQIKGQARRKLLMQAVKPHLKTIATTVIKETASFFVAPISWADMTRSLLKRRKKLLRQESYRQFSDTPNAVHSPEVKSVLDDLSSKAKDKFKESEFIKQPKEKCESSIDPVREFLKSNGFTDENIKVRGMYLWANGVDSSASNHFVIVGIKDGEKYVVDITAAQFEKVGISEPLYLTESDWAKKYQGAFSRTLIKYQDFDSPSDARRQFGTTTVHSCYPMLTIKGATRLTEPSWYTEAIAKIKAGHRKVEDYKASNLQLKKTPFSESDSHRELPKPIEASKGDLAISAFGDGKSALLGKANSELNEKTIKMETPSPEDKRS